jgi:Tfp pilus assembly protein FimT
MNTIERLWRAIRQQDKVDELQGRVQYYRTEALKLQDEIQWRAHRQSEASRKGWETRKSKARQMMRAVDMGDI